MLDFKSKCYTDKYNVKINSELHYEEGFGLLQRLFECIEIGTELPKGRLIIYFKNCTYYFPISKSDNMRIAQLLHNLKFDIQYV